MSQFGFLAPWPEFFQAAQKAEAAAIPDPRTACFYARRALELAVQWLYQHDRSLAKPYDDNLSALVHAPSFKATAGEAVFHKAKFIITMGNQAVHHRQELQSNQAVRAVAELFHVGYWLARTYGRTAPPPELAFDVRALPQTSPVPVQTQKQLEELAARLLAQDTALAQEREKSDELQAELARLREELAAVKAARQVQPDTHDYAEDTTRAALIDVLLAEAGWTLGQARDREFEVRGMPNTQGVGYVDYVLWGDDGRPLGLVEAKRVGRSPMEGQQQARLYADCLERQFGQRPVIFLSNGYEHWLWDDARYPQRRVQGFYTKEELTRLIARRTTLRPLASEAVNRKIADRYYQERAIRRVAESFEKDQERRALLVMATGAGKTRTVIGLCDLLMRCSWVKRVLFLADRVALVNQAAGAFLQHLPDVPPVNLIQNRDGDGRVFVSTYPTMMGCIEEVRDCVRRFGVGAFYLIVIDEAHRSVFQKYRAIFEYFDALLVGLTATPRDEVDRNTYDLFHLETGVPTDVYELDQAVSDRYLVPPRAVSVPLKFQREGISYGQLSSEEQEQWDQLEWDEEGGEIPERVEPEAVNRWLFNQDTVDRVLEHLMRYGEKVAGGDRLGKTIVFAKNQAHAEFIAERFDANYPHFKGEFARIITFKTEYADSLITAFKQKDANPHIAISVDMLDTGVDIPEVVNLVFFKMVRSKTKFWQMVGRGTRLCRDLYGPGIDKTHFCIFDFCQNLEFFSSAFKTQEPSLVESLGKRLFLTRLELVGELDRTLGSAPEGTAVARELPEAYVVGSGEPLDERRLRRFVAHLLHDEVSRMNVDNFIVRPHRRAVERFSRPEAWVRLGNADVAELTQEVAGLPSAMATSEEEARRFDLLMLRLQLARLRGDAGFVRLQENVRGIAALLIEKSSIPMVAAQLRWIEDVLSDPWWEDVTVPMLEQVRLRLRALVGLIEKRSRKIVYANFTDEVGPHQVVSLPGIPAGFDLERFRAKARAFLRAHLDHLAVHKLRMAEPLTPTDLAELERILVESGVGTPDEVAHARQAANGLGVFVRSLVGLDREAAKRAFTGFLAGRPLTADQIEFVDMIVNSLTERGVMDAALLYESPFTDLSPCGPEQLFTPTQVDELEGILVGLRRTAEG